MRTIISEFRRRNVFRVAALYLVSAWLIAQVADVVIGLGELPPAIGRAVLTILAVGFPVAVAVSWLFQWTPEGIRRESDVPGVPPTVSEGGLWRRQRLDYVIISLLSVALVYFIATHDWRGPPQVLAASIAVLPFENRSAQPDDLYFTDGIHEDILTQLAKVSSIVVISRTSVMQYRDSVRTIPEIARELGVATVLEGGVQRAGNRVRINLQLIEAASDRHLWAETYDRELTIENVFAIQSEIASSIAETLHARLLPQELARIETLPTDSLEAYDAYLLGQRYLAKRNAEDLARARDFFTRAVEEDADFALAYTGLAGSLYLLSEYIAHDRENQIRQAEAAATRALELNPALGEAHTAFGIVLQAKGERSEVYGRYFERGVELAPGSADARKWYVGYLGESGEYEEALEQLLKAVQLDPMSPIIRVNLAGALRNFERYDEAAAHIQRALEIDPRFAPAILAAGDIESADDALAATSKAYAEDPNNPWALLDFTLGYLEMRDGERAAQWVAELDRIAPDSMQNFIANLNLNLHRFRQADALEYATRLAKFENGVITLPTRTLLLEDLRRGQPEVALERYEHKYPNLLGDDPKVADNYSAAIDVAWLMKALGDTAKADRLLDRSLDFISRLPEGQAINYAIFEARIYAMRGQDDEALVSIRKAVDAGWRFHWWYFMEQDPVLARLRNHPRFQLMWEELKSQTHTELEAVRRLEVSGNIALPPSS